MKPPRPRSRPRSPGRTGAPETGSATLGAPRTAPLPRLAPRPTLAPTLERWYRAGHRDLPWRRTRDPWAIWVSEIMLQQTQVETVIPYYQRFLARFPDVEALASASLDDVLSEWQGLGYYARARHLHEAAGRLVSDNACRLPDTLEGFLALPGVGRSTAGSILCFAQDQRHPVLDANVKRVLLRAYDVHADPASPPVERWLWEASTLWLADAESPGDYNQALLDLGATICRPRSPECSRCPIARGCRARRAGTQEALPWRRPAKARPHHVVVVGVISREGRGGSEEVLIQQRAAKGLLGGLWEFPGGKQEPGETLAAALSRELAEELGVEVEVGPELINLAHAYSHFSITLHAFRCRLRKGRPRARAAQAVRWVPREALTDYPFPRANQRVLERLLGEETRTHDSRGRPAARPRRRGPPSGRRS